MNRFMANRFRFLTPALAILALMLTCLLYGQDTGSDIQVQVDATKAGPRQVENLTEMRIVRDYRTAWTNLAQALEGNSLAPLDGPFAGAARDWLRATVVGQQRSGLSQRYLNQTHKLDAVFYAPEGDLMELHDTATYRLQVLDGGKVIQDEPVSARYVVLMTPGADHWMIRQLQSVPQF